MLLTGLRPKEKTWCWALWWTGWRHRSRKIWRYFRQNMPPMKKAGWSYRIGRILWFIREPCTYTQCPKVRLKISCSLWSPRPIMLPLWTGATEMQVIKGATTPYPCCGSTSGGQVWPTRYSSLSGTACVACSMRAIFPKPPYTWLWPPLWWTFYMWILELNRLPKVANVLMCQDHLMKHIMAYVTHNQTTKAVAKFLCQGYISIFGALARLLSDQGANCMSIIIDMMCKLLGIKKLQTAPYHPQMNGLMERSHQTIMWMIGKLGEDGKANWPGHLAEIVHAYNATQSTVTGYNPHYLMFGYRLRLLVNFYFPTLRSAEVPKRGASTKCMDEYVATDWGLFFKRPRPSLWMRLKDKNGITTGK